MILTSNMPVCTDLLTIGAGTIIRKDSVFHLLSGLRREHPDRPGQCRQ